MTATIGRVGIDTSIENIRSLSFDGDRLTIRGTLNAPTKEELFAQRDQLRGLVEPGAQRIVPFTWDADDSLDGFYEINSVGVTPSKGVSFEDPAWAEYEVDLYRLPGGNALPGIESILIGGHRPNDLGYAENTNDYNSSSPSVEEPKTEWHVPASATELEAITPVSMTDLGYDTYRIMGWRGGYQTEVVRWAIAPGDFYDGACLIEHEVGSTWMAAVGRQVVVTDTAKLRISNGYMGVTFDHPTDDNELGVRFHGFGRTAGVLDWTARSGFIQLSSNLLNDCYVTAITVLRNDPEEVRVRLSAAQAGINPGPYTFRTFFYVDVSLRRGVDYITALFSRGLTPGARLDVTTNVAVTDTPSGSGIYQTTASGGVQPWAIASDAAVTTDNVVGSFYVASGGNPMPFGIGPVWNGYTSGFNQSTEVRWMAPIVERQRIVGR